MRRAVERAVSETLAPHRGSVAAITFRKVARVPGPASNAAVGAALEALAERGLAVDRLGRAWALESVSWRERRSYRFRVLEPSGEGPHR